MSGPFFQKETWPAFVYQGTTYEFTHLNEYYVEVADSAKVMRRIAISFSDHCFTREPKPGDDPALRYAESSRNPGFFCVERYRLSLDLASHIARALGGSVWNLGYEGYAVVPTVDHQGKRTLYGIVFSLDPVTGLPVQLHMRVKSAHPRNSSDIITYGIVKFSQLVTLRLQRKHPKRNVEKGRKRPWVT